MDKKYQYNKLRQQIVWSFMFSFITEVTYHSKFFLINSQQITLSECLLNSAFSQKTYEKQIEKNDNWKLISFTDNRIFSEVHPDEIRGRRCIVSHEFTYVFQKFVKYSGRGKASKPLHVEKLGSKQSPKWGLLLRLSVKFSKTHQQFVSLTGYRNTDKTFRVRTSYPEKTLLVNIFLYKEY